MSLIRRSHFYPSRKQPGKPLLLLCGFGGAIWQTKRLIITLNRAGYDVTALDFPKEVLSIGNPALLPQLVDEVVAFAEAEAASHSKTPLLVGISLGALLALNILRRSNTYTTGVLITGGNIVRVAQNIYGKRIWPQTHEALSKTWQTINIHSRPEQLAEKRMLFVLPTKDKLIDTSEVIAEIKAQNKAGNSIRLLERTSFGHVGTIVEETILFPHRILAYIKEVTQA